MAWQKASTLIDEQVVNSPEAQTQTPSVFQRALRNLDRPRGAFQSLIRGGSAIEGFKSPESVPDYRQRQAESVASSAPGSVLKDSIGLAGASAADFFTDPLNIIPGLGAAKSSGLLKGMVSTRRGIEAPARAALKSPQGAEAFGKGLVGAFKGARKGAQAKFDEGFQVALKSQDTSKNVVDLTEEIGLVSKHWDEGTLVGQRLQKAGTEAGDNVVEEILTDPNLDFTKVPIEIAQRFKKVLNETATNKAYYKSGLLDKQGASDLIKIAGSTGTKQTTANPFLKPVFKEYGEFSEAAKRIGGRFKTPESAIGLAKENPILRSNRAAASRRAAAEKVLPPESIQQMNFFQKKVNPNPLIKNPYVRKAADVVGTGAALYGIGKGGEKIIKYLSE